MENSKIYFSVSHDWMMKTQEMPFNIFINSSSVEGKMHFIRIIEKGSQVDPFSIVEFKKKYGQLYLCEDDRWGFLEYLTSKEEVNFTDKVQAIKDSAIHHISNLFNTNNQFSSEFLSRTIGSCKRIVETMVDTIKEKNLTDIHRLIAALNFHDFYTYDHSVNVSMYCIYMHRQIFPNSKNEDIVAVGLGGLLHDIGKVSIPTQIINFPGALSESDFQLIKTHPQNGIDLISKCVEENKDNELNLSKVRRIIYEHHENFNGKGYPKGISGVEIDMSARIASLADFFDAITTKRSYGNVLPLNEALSVMEKSKGQKLDPMLFNLFAQTVSDFEFNQGVQCLPDDFDCCRPHLTLPLHDVPKAQNKEFGKITHKKGGALESKLDKIKKNNH